MHRQALERGIFGMFFRKRRAGEAGEWEGRGEDGGRYEHGEVGRVQIL